MAGDKKTLKFQMMMAPEEAEILDDWMFKHRIRSRAEAIRRLTQIGMILDRRVSAYLTQEISGPVHDDVRSAIAAVLDLYKSKDIPLPIVDVINGLVSAIQAKESTSLVELGKMTAETWPLKQPMKIADAEDFRRQFKEKLDALDPAAPETQKEIVRMLNVLSGRDTKSSKDQT